MNILSSHKISGVLFDIIHGARKELVLVSPYVNLTYWKQLATALTAARDRGVKIDFYVRHEPGNVLSKEQVESLGITPHLVANLHAKFYYNETSGLVTSLNLLGVSNSNSIEIGCQLDSAKEVDELRRFVQQHLAPQEAVKSLGEEDKHLSTKEFGQVLADYLEEHVDAGVQVNGQGPTSLGIQALGNTFSVDIEGSPSRLLLRGVVSSREAERFPAKQGKHFTSPLLRHDVQHGGKGYYDQLRGTLQAKLSAAKFNALTLSEKKELLTYITYFITAVRAFKDDYR